MSNVKDIRTALEARLAAITSPLDTQWENTAYKPIADKPYQKVDLLLAEPVNPEMGGYVQQGGIMQVMLRFPANSGTGAIATAAQAVRDWFYKGLTLAANGTTLTINRTPNIAAGGIDGDRYLTAVKIRFFSNSGS